MWDMVNDSNHNANYYLDHKLLQLKLQPSIKATKGTTAATTTALKSNAVQSQQHKAEQYVNSKYSKSKNYANSVNVNDKSDGKSKTDLNSWHLLKKSTIKSTADDELSWTFLDHVDTLDQQLRKTEYILQPSSSSLSSQLSTTLSPLSFINECHLLPSALNANECCDITSEVDSIVYEGMPTTTQAQQQQQQILLPNTQQQHSRLNLCKSNKQTFSLSSIHSHTLPNGHALNVTATTTTSTTTTTTKNSEILSNEILSQAAIKQEPHIFEVPTKATTLNNLNFILPRKELRNTELTTTTTKTKTSIHTAAATPVVYFNVNAETGGEFVFTTPTLTFQRRKLQQLERQRQQEQEQEKEEEVDPHQQQQVSLREEQQQSSNDNRKVEEYEQTKETNENLYNCAEERPLKTVDYDYDNQNGSQTTLRQTSTSNNNSSNSSNTNNNNDNSGNRNTISTSKEYQDIRQHTNDRTSAMINSNTGVIITDTVAHAHTTNSLIGNRSGNRSERGDEGKSGSSGGGSSISCMQAHTEVAPTSRRGSGKYTCKETTRTLKTPTLTSDLTANSTNYHHNHNHNRNHNYKHNCNQSYNNAADGVDLVDDTKTEFHTTKLPNQARQTRKPNRMVGIRATDPNSCTNGTNSNSNNSNDDVGDSIADCSNAIKGLPNNSHGSLVDDIEIHLGLIGWRKKCLYILLLLLILLIITNLVLTLWIIRVMEFSTKGMGQLKIVPEGIHLNGQAFIMDVLRASTIRSRYGQPISIESSRNFSINTRDMNGMLENHLFLGHDKLECLAKGFRINDTAGRNLFSVNRNEVTIGAHALRVEGEGGAIFHESIQTPHVRAEPGRELRLESPTRQLDVSAAKDINLQSRAGSIELSALKDIKLSAIDGSLRFEATKIFMPNLRTAQLPLPNTPQSREHLHRVFQLCACSNGKLFLASPHSVCAGDDTSVCR